MSRLGSIAASSAASRSSTSLPQSTLALAASSSTLPAVDAHLIDYLAIEMSDILVEAASHAQDRQDKRRSLIEAHLEAEYPGAAIRDPSYAAATTQQDQAQLRQAQINEGVYHRLEAIGFRLGWCLAERLAKERPPIAKQVVQQTPASVPVPQIGLPLEPLEIVKFLCKDVWVTLYEKQIDNLRTNHRGVFVLSDTAFKPLLHLSPPSAPSSAKDEAASKARLILATPCGVIRGTLAVLGLGSVCTAELGQGGACTFQIKSVAKAPSAVGP